MPHLPYSPDFTLSDFYFFGTIKQHLRGAQGQSFDDLKWSVQANLDAIPPEEIFATFRD
jgi:hypothetical protein